MAVNEPIAHPRRARNFTQRRDILAVDWRASLVVNPAFRCVSSENAHPARLSLEHLIVSRFPLPELKGELSALCRQTAVVEGLPIGAGKTRLDGGQVFFDVEVEGMLTTAEPGVLVFDERVRVRHLVPEAIDLSPLLGHPTLWRSTQGAGEHHGFQAILSVYDVPVLWVSDRARAALSFPPGEDLFVFEGKDRRQIAVRTRLIRAEAS